MLKIFKTQKPNPTDPGFTVETKEKSRWIIYNEGEDIEFAECEKCGHEQEFETLDSLVHGVDRWIRAYPGVCPNCKRWMRAQLKAEDVF